MVWVRGVPGGNDHYAGLQSLEEVRICSIKPTVMVENADIDRTHRLRHKRFQIVPGRKIIEHDAR